MPSSACPGHRRALLSFPTRRSSDLRTSSAAAASRRCCSRRSPSRRSTCSACSRSSSRARRRARSKSRPDGARRGPRRRRLGYRDRGDRKSTRLNSSHGYISYAVFCLPRPPPSSTLFPYTTLFRSSDLVGRGGFPPVLLAPISFEALYLQRLQQEQQSGSPQSKIEVAT